MEPYYQQSVCWGDGEDSGILVNFNGITGNGIYGVESQRTASDVHVENNWWGHASGTSGDNGGVNKVGKVIGQGGAFSVNVDWDPLLPQQVGYTKHDTVPPGLCYNLET
ncbi:hypothetical protein ACFLU8_04750 [Chloroflexota bacterium]